MPKFEFSGLAFPVITVRLGNGKGRASMVDYDKVTRRATESYSYDQKDGVDFAATVARKLWDKVQPDADATILIPGNVERGGYVFIAVPSYYIAER